MIQRFLCFSWIFISLAFSLTTGLEMDSIAVVSATIASFNTIEIQFNTPYEDVQIDDFSFKPRIALFALQRVDRKIRIYTEPIDLHHPLELCFRGQRFEVQPDQVLNSFYSDLPMGCTWTDDETIFRLFAPRAQRVTLGLFANLDESAALLYPMERDADGVWCVRLPGLHFGKSYAYRIDGPDGASENFAGDRWVADPYSRAVASKNEYLHRSQALIRDFSAYDWQDDAPVRIAAQDLVIYECHVRDLVAHPSAGISCEKVGVYAALIDADARGGLNHLRSLGVNAVEFLPIHEFGNLEIPFGIPVDGVTNTWNPYARNHWGYMTSYFFAPESYYASDGSMTPARISGHDGRQVEEFKDVVKALHRAGMAVILDVVYNHVAQYDQNSFKLIDKKYYFRLDEEGNYLSASGCGNDFYTERPMARRLILDSVRYWMSEYHIDGFRFDLAAMLDWQTIDEIREMARSINPDVILIAEPWGGGRYEPSTFSSRDWAAWNDQFRNGIKGQNPETGLGYIFGRWWGGDSLESLKKYLGGTLQQEGGLFQKPAHSVNYLASHDDHSLGDFIRIGSGEVAAHEPIRDLAANACLTPLQMRINKLAALILFTAQGAIMLTQGQEYGHSKVIAPTKAPDPSVGFIDHNSYNKDNETNWLNYNHAAINRELVDYYRGLIALRRQHPALRRTPRNEMIFMSGDSPMSLGVYLPRKFSGDTRDILVLMNPQRTIGARFAIPEGSWELLADDSSAGVVPLRRVSGGQIECPPLSGMILCR